MQIKFKRRFVTLIEMMIVMFLIALITGVIAYNYRGSLEEGKAFKTKAGMEKVTTILNLRAAEDPDLMSNIENKWQDAIRNSPLVQNANALIYDGWGEPYRVTVDNGMIQVTSPRYDTYRQGSTQSMFK